MSTSDQNKSETGSFAALVDDLRWLLQYIKVYWTWVVGALLIGLVTSAAQNGRALLIRPLMDQAIPKDNVDYLIWIAGMALGLSLVGAVGVLAHRYLAMYIKERLMVDIRMALFKHLIHLPLSFYADREQGDLISRTTNDIKVTRQLLRTMIGKMLIQPFKAITALGVALLASWQLTILFLVIFAVSFSFFQIFGRKVRKYKKQSLSRMGDVVESLHQLFSGLRIIKAFQGEKREVDRFHSRNKKLLKRNMKVVKHKALAKSVMGFLKGALLAAALLVGSWLIVSESAPFELTLGTLLQFIFGMGLLYQPVRKMVKGYINIQETRAGVARLREILKEQREGELEKGPSEEEIWTGELPQLSEGVQVRNVQFSYDEESVLKGISLEIEAGETVALVGESGAGKTTLINLLGRFYLPDSGQILFDSVPIREMNRSRCMQYISLVSQKSFLFNSTIEENIRYGNPSASQENVIEAAKAAYIHDFIQSLPEGYETKVGDRGGRISGGQRQRIAIARALLKGADLLLLDEATSNLDTKSENYVQKALERILEDRTCVVIAHRLSTIKNADRIFVMEEGEIMEEGAHQNLLQRDGLYRQFYEEQLRTRD